MDSIAPFRRPRLAVSRDDASNQNALAFYQRMLENQLSRNDKMRKFELDLHRQTDRTLTLLDTRAEKQQHVVRQLEEEAAHDHAWKELLRNLRDLGALSKSNRTFELSLSKHLDPNCADDLQRQRQLDSCVADVVSGKAYLSINAIRAATEILEVSIYDAQQLVELLAELVGVRDNLVSFLKEGTKGLDALERLVWIRNLLENRLVKWLEVDEDEGVRGVVKGAREGCAELGLTLENLEKMRAQAEESRAAKVQAQVQAQVAQTQAAAQAQIAPVAVAASAPTTTTTTTTTTSLHPFFPYIALSSKKQQWLSDVKKNASQALPAELEEALRRTVSRLSYADLCREASGNISLAQLDALLADLESLLHSVVRGGASAFLRVFIALSETVVEEVRGVNAEEDILMYAVVVCGVFRALSANMHKQSAQVFSQILASASDLCVPNLLLGGRDKFSSGRVRITMLFAALVGQAEGAAASPLTAAQGWTWMQRAGTQLHLMIALQTRDADVPRPSDNSVAAAAKLVRTFLRLGGNVLFVRYQGKFAELLGGLRATIGGKELPDLQNLSKLIDDALDAKLVAPLHYRGQAPFMLEAAALIRYADRELSAVAEAEKDKKGAFMTRVKAMQIDRLRNIFNKLSVTVESQELALRNLLEKIVTANAESPDFLKYVLFKICSNILTDCQEEFFMEMDEGHPLKLARVACGLCVQIKELPALLKAQFYKLCPLSVPKVAEVGLAGDAFLRDMGFRGGEGSWEDKSSWLTRMTKMLVTFTVMTMQPEQTPLALRDAWAWLAHLVNTHTARSIKPPFFTATALEVILRVAGRLLHSTYGQQLMDLLVLIQTRILPTLGDAPRAKELGTFLSLFISSRGQNFLAWFNRPVESTE